MRRRFGAHGLTGMWVALLVCGWLLSGLVSGRSAAESLDGGDGSSDRVDFRREIRPILSDRCFTCHGPDEAKRRADLRLDTREGAFEDLGGYAAVVSGKPEESALYRRVTHEDSRDRMPPASTKKTVTPEEIETIRRWIEQGAPWQEHWAYLPVVRPAVPEVGDRDLGDPGFVKGPVDRFVLDHLRRKGLRPSPEADRVTLLRRLSFDLLGLPPTPAEADAFAVDATPDAYERKVDELLASPHYGERMAVYWLDLVRYADTTGYHGDNHRDVWAYRDYVIRAFNENMPFDRFTREQLAGDLLAGSTDEQKIASGYNRLNMTTQEGGAQPKEYIAKYAADRVRNVSSVWSGATMGCAECHDHKYDPYTTRDFYQFAAFFADVQEMAIGEPGPGFPLTTREQALRLAAMDAGIAELRRKIEQPGEDIAEAQERWEEAVRQRSAPEVALGEWRSAGPFAGATFDDAHDRDFGPETSSSPEATYVDGTIRWVARPDWTDGQIHELAGESSATYLAREVEVDEARNVGLSLGSDDGIRVWLNGKQVLDRKILRGVAPDQEALSLDLPAGKSQLLVKVSNGGGGYGFYFRLDSTDLPAGVLEAVRTPRDARTPEQAGQVRSHYRSISPELATLRKDVEAAEKEKAEFHKTIPTTQITMSVTPRPVRILPRGNWMDESGEVVQPAVPHFLQPIGKEGRADRLDLANWLVSKDNPLTARVFVNRLWKLLFGQGIARNLDDLGSQGAPPTHPELLDWLASELVESGWDVKHVVRLLVRSGTYRQSSVAARDALDRDPTNAHLARQSRWRLSAELVRDTALKVVGLLSPEIGGPSVKPPQPAGYWGHLNFPKRTYAQDHGEAVLRRGLYTYWQRTFLYPSYLAFDAPTREDCTAERVRSNTPLQALVLLNDPVYVEAARALGARMLADGGSDPAEKIRWGVREAITREPARGEVELLEALYRKHHEAYRGDPEAARALLKVGEHPVLANRDPVELAAWTSVARVLLNLQETFTRN